MKQRLFQYTVLLHPAKNSENQKTEIIVPVTDILSPDEKSVQMTAILAIPADKRDELDRIEIAVRPF